MYKHDERFRVIIGSDLVVPIWTLVLKRRDLNRVVHKVSCCVV